MPSKRHTSIESFETICPVYMLEASDDSRERRILDVGLSHDLVLHNIYNEREECVLALASDSSLDCLAKRPDV
jgi:hypothetical protein